MKIYVTGGLRSNSPEDREVARALGRAIAKAGHTLVQGYYNEFDHIVAEAAFGVAKDSELFTDPRLSVQSFITADVDAPKHVEWPVRKLPFRDWDPADKNWSVPEPIQSCEVAIVLGGGLKTLRAANLCRLTNKPILPITALGGAAVEVFQKEMQRFSTFYHGSVSREEYTLLDVQNPSDIAALVEDAVKLASRIVASNTVFIIMAFRDDSHESEDTFSSIKDICAENGWKWQRTDQDPTTDRIYRRIVDGIQRAGFVIADVSVPTLNVYYELGFAEALGKTVVVIAKEGTQLPFDTQDIPTTFFRNQTRLKEELRKRCKGLVAMATQS